MSKPKEIPAYEEIPDLGVDREQGLSNSFEDPGMEEFLPDLSLETPGGDCLVNETAQAVQELLLSGSDAQSGFPQQAEAVFTSDENSGELAYLRARAELSAELFSLVASGQPFDQMVEAILAVLMKASQAEAGSILEFDRQQGEFFFRAAAGGGDPEKVKAFRVPAGKGIVGHVAETRQPMLLKSMDTDEKELRAISMSSGFEAKSCMALPILIQGQLFGVLELFNKSGDQGFHEFDLELVEEGVREAAKVLEVRFLTAELLKRVG